MDQQMYGFGSISLILYAVIVIIPFWMIFSKAGHSKWLSLLMILPIVNLILLYYLAFSRWPALEETDNQF